MDQISDSQESVLSLDPKESSYNCALVRGLSSSFENSLKISPPPIPVDLALATAQHQRYIETLKSLLPRVVELEGDPAYPDCNFIEDTAVWMGDTAVISFLGAPERRGEETPVMLALRDLGVQEIFRMTPPATMDGGDILITGNHVFVGLSKRTNESALEQLKEILGKKYSVFGVSVIEGLHLKSVVSAFDSETLVVADNPAGRWVQREIDTLGLGYEFVFVPDSVASNVLRVGSTVLIQDGYPQSEAILCQLCEKRSVKWIKLNMSELIKADGALTCGSILLKTNNA